MYNAEQIQDLHQTLPSLNNESQLQNHKESALSSLPPTEPALNYDLMSNSITKSPNTSNNENSPETLIPQLKSTLETTNFVNISGNCSSTTSGNGCAIAIQVDEDYDDEENEDEISETVALTQKFDKNRTKKN